MTSFDNQYALTRSVWGDDGNKGDVQMTDAQRVHWLRTICARELAPTPYDYDWFSGSWLPGETDADAALLRMFTEERPYHDSDLATVLVMCHG